GLEMPLVVPRASVRLLDEKTARKLAGLGLSPADVAGGEDDLLRRVVEAPELAAPEIAARLLSAFDGELDRLRPALAASGPGVDIAIAKTRASVEAAVLKLIAKYESANLHRDQQAVAEIRRWCH